MSDVDIVESMEVSDVASLNERSKNAQKQLSLTIISSTRAETALNRNKPLDDNDSSQALEKRYAKRLEAVESLRKQIHEQISDYSKRTFELQEILRKREKDTLDMEDTFWKLTREISAEMESTSVCNEDNKRANELHDIHSKNSIQAKQLERLRLKQQNYQQSIKKIKSCLKQYSKLEEDGLNLTDLEHLQGQHGIVKQKLEQRRREISKLTKTKVALTRKLSKTEQTVNDIQASMSESKPELLVLDKKISDERKRLSSLKHKYESICEQTSEFKKKQTFEDNLALRHDFELTSKLVQDMTEKVQQLQERHRKCQKNEN